MTSKDQFIIKDDKTADWALAQIAEAEQERDRLIDLANAKILELNQDIEKFTKRCEDSTGYLKSLLYDYFRTVKPKNSKTQASYKLISGTLIFKKPSVKIIHNDDKLLEYLKNNEGTDFIKVKESVDWAGFKAVLTINENEEIIDTGLGTIIPKDVCDLEEVPGEFKIKFKEEE